MFFQIFSSTVEGVWGSKTTAPRCKMLSVICFSSFLHGKDTNKTKSSEKVPPGAAHIETQEHNLRLVLTSINKDLCAG